MAILLVLGIVLILTSTASAAMGDGPIEGTEINIVADYCHYF